MFSLLRNRFGIPGVIAVIALVFAMIGGAYAASKGLTSKQKKEVTKIAKKYAGKPGATGPQGPAGPAGANGKDGANGQNGANGKDGKSVVTGIATPAECPDGGITVEVQGSGVKKKICNGKTGFTETLPSGMTETGTWVALGEAASQEGVDYSFAIPLAAPLDGAHVHFFSDTVAGGAPGGDFGATCTGSTTNPTAPSGHLCVYGEASSTALVDPAGPITIPGDGLGASTAGAITSFLFLESGQARGMWAVTG